MQEAPTEQLPRAETACPSCGAPAERDQLVCLECGARISLDYRSPPGWKLPAAIVGAVLVVAAAAFGVGLNEIANDAESEVASERAGKPQRGARKPARRKPPARAERRTERRTRRPRRGRRARPRQRPRPRPTAPGAVPSWPAGRRAFTVVLLSAGDRPGAIAFARNLRRQGVRAGVLRSNDYSSLEPGFWIVFSGVHRSRPRAENAAARLGQRYNGAFPQLVSGARRGRR